MIEKTTHIKILFFGQLVDITGVKELALENVTDTNTLLTILHQRFPALVQSKYIIAVNQQMISENISLTDNSIVALLPPFSGG